MQPRLLALTGSLAGTTKPLTDRPLTIGRDPTNDLQLPSHAISRRHCRIEPAEGGHCIVDLDSRNGTFVNGIPIKTRKLVHGDQVRLFDIELLYLVTPGEPAVGARRTPEHPLPDLSNLPTAFIPKLTTERPEASPNFSLGDHVGRMARDLSALFQISHIINSVRDAEKLQRDLLRLIFEVVPAERGAILLLAAHDQADDSLCVWHRDGSEAYVEIPAPLAQQAIWDRTSLVMNATENTLCVPLVAIERIVGVIFLASTGENRRFFPDHVSFLESVSRIAAVTLENILLLNSLRTENVQLKQQLNPPRILIGESREITQLEKLIDRVARTDSTVLIRGESGTGKEVVSRSIHNASNRRDKPFVAINCAAIPETLLESELFGSEKGAFTGANAQRKGKLEAAGDGTVLLDEIGELPPPMQAKLLRVLQQREFERVGGTVTIPLKARVLAATNKDLEEAIKTGEFRQDLYYRLNVVSLKIPPLRNRAKDIPLLALYFAAKYAERFNRPFKGISREARAMLLAYDWPGNVRELENAIEHAIVLGLTDEILPEDLPINIVEQQSDALAGATYNDAVNEKKKELIRSSLAQTNGSVPEAARLLSLHPKYLHRLIRNLKIKTEK